MKIILNRLNDLLKKRKRKAAQINSKIKKANNYNYLQELFIDYENTQKCIDIFDQYENSDEWPKNINKEFFCFPFYLILELDNYKKICAPWIKESWGGFPTEEDLCGIAGGYKAKKITFICQTEPFVSFDKYDISQSRSLYGQNGYYLDDTDAIIIDME